MTTNRPRMIRVPDQLWDLAQARAKREGESLAAVIRRFLRTYTGTSAEGR